MIIRSIFLLWIAVLFTTTVHAQQMCRNDLEEYTPTSRFVLNNDGTVTDKNTRMTWMRCALGQKWDGKDCAGIAQTYSWQEARDVITRMNEQGYAGHNDWRLPLVPNLASIVERRCLNPRINEEVFPETALGPFWTSMEKKGRTKFAYIVDFGEGNAGPLDKERKAHVRVVRGEPWWTPPQMPEDY